MLFNLQKEKNKTFVWQFKSLVSDRPIVIEIPGDQSPLGKVMLLFRLMAVAVLLFGAGFWYLSEQKEPGMLDCFRWGHFFLLALTYSLFFIIFSVLSFQGELKTGVTMAIAALFSLPLLILHVSRVVGFKFALTRVLPLTLFTLILVINGVYGGHFRDTIFIIGVILVIGYLTITYDKWTSGRGEYQKQQKKLKQDEKEKLNHYFISEIGAILVKSETLLGETKKLLDYFSVEEIQLIEHRLISEENHFVDLSKDYTNLMNRFNYLPSMDSWEYPSSFTSLEKDIEDFEIKLQQNFSTIKMISQSLQKSREKLLEKEQKERKEQKELKEKAKKQTENYCTACGEPGEATPFCQNCGVPRTEVLYCGECETPLTLFLHLIHLKENNKKMHCFNCGTNFHIKPSIFRRIRVNEDLKD